MAEQRLERVFAQLPGGSETPDPDSVARAERQGFGSTSQFVYGEAAPGLVGPTLENLGLQANDVFFDLGSGRGRLVLGAAVVPAGPSACARAVGIELDRKRHDIALRAQSLLGPTERPCTLLCDDMLTTPLDEATVAFSNNVVFGTSLNAALANALSAERAPNLRAVATTAPLPQEAASAAGLALQRVSVLAVNWCRAGHTLYRYGRAPPEGGIMVDSDAGAMIEAMRADVVNGDSSPNSKDMAYMRIAAFVQEMTSEVQDWQAFYAKANS